MGGFHEKRDTRVNTPGGARGRVCPPSRRELILLIRFPCHASRAGACRAASDGTQSRGRTLIEDEADQLLTAASVFPTRTGFRPDFHALLALPTSPCPPAIKQVPRPFPPTPQPPPTSYLPLAAGRNLLVPSDMTSCSRTPGSEDRLVGPLTT